MKTPQGLSVFTMEITKEVRSGTQTKTLRIKNTDRTDFIIKFAYQNAENKNTDRTGFIIKFAYVALSHAARKLIFV